MVRNCGEDDLDLFACLVRIAGGCQNGSQGATNFMGLRVGGEDVSAKFLRLGVMAHDYVGIGELALSCPMTGKQREGMPETLNGAQEIALVGIQHAEVEEGVGMF